MNLSVTFHWVFLSFMHFGFFLNARLRDLFPFSQAVAGRKIEALQRRQPKKDRQNRTDRKRQPEGGSQNGTCRTEQAEQDCLAGEGCPGRAAGEGSQHRTARIRQPGQDRKEITARTEHLEQDSQNGNIRTGQAEEKRQNKTASTGLSGQDC
jgi:hypothetical protein